jgi:DEAD/DEAH box helicase domain-containing protein
MRVITFDVETKNVFEDVGSNDPVDLDISVVCIHDSLRSGDADGGFSSYLEKDFGKLWPIMESADALVTFNGNHFDIPLLNKYYSGDLGRIKSIDLLASVRDSLGRRIKLDTLAEATLGVKKSGHGLDAITWWKEGDVEKIIKYCIDDVKITRDLYDYALTKGHLKYKDFSANGMIRDIPINTSSWLIKPKEALTFTLPF